MFFENKLLKNYIQELKNHDVIVFSDVSIERVKFYIRKTNSILPSVIYIYILFYSFGLKLPLWNMIKKFIDNVIILMQKDNST